MFLSLILANFAFKFPNFRCHGNKVHSGLNFSHTITLRKLKKTLFGTISMALSIIQTELCLILCQYSPIFVAMATRVDQGSISGIRLNCATLKTPVLCNILSCIAYLKQVVANFVSKIPTFCCHGNEGRPRVNYSYIAKLPDLDNPLIGAKFLALCLVLAELWLIYCQNFHIFVTMATGVCLM